MNKWERRDAKRAKRMPVHGRGYVRTVVAGLVKRVKAARKESP